ncbi:hypothetical protein Slin15195_G049160 [Septoria linicola]|uniref:Uncharacterized protein n=1 Tax=Septoria linicola TaxID=215465 RepID=A0A9Q9AT94_9PEZI|nr:hypothetical protein Slin15195_G049160 [Septoria linicola]
MHMYFAIGPDTVPLFSAEGLKLIGKNIQQSWPKKQHALHEVDHFRLKHYTVKQRAAKKLEKQVERIERDLRKAKDPEVEADRRKVQAENEARRVIAESERRIPKGIRAEVLRTRDTDAGKQIAVAP